MRRAVILAGTGAVGHAAADRLVRRGWRVEVTGRDRTHLDPALAAAGVSFHAADRRDRDQLGAVLGGGADLVVDCACFTADHARQIETLLADVTSMVMVSSKAVYADEHGRHSNSDVPPEFPGPIMEGQPTVAPLFAGDDYESREGYAAHKVGAEHVLLNSGHAVSVIRASKVHGVRARRPREWFFVRRVLDGRTRVVFESSARAGDHPTAAVNLAALIEIVASNPGARVLNCADPDTPSEREIASIIARHFDHVWEEVVLEGAIGVVQSPWHVVPPIALDTSAARALGYEPVGDFASTVRPTLDWLAGEAAKARHARAPMPFTDPFFDEAFDYATEDAAVGR